MAKPKKPVRVYHHTPMVTDQFDNADLVSSQVPLPGIPFHADPGLARRVRNWGRAPDQFFEAGIAAPPLGLNTSGIRNYTVDLDMDPNRVINLDVPLASQTREVRDALRRMGISTDDAWTGNPLTPAELLWQQTIADNAPQADDAMFNELAARRLASGDYLGNSEEAKTLANSLSFPMLEMLLDYDIPAATRKGPGIAAGGYYAPQDGPYPNVPEFKVFNPDIARIVRAAAIPGAIAAGAAATDAEAATPGKMSRREFLRRVGGAVGSAALPMPSISPIAAASKAVSLPFGIDFLNYAHLQRNPLDDIHLGGPDEGTPLADMLVGIDPGQASQLSRDQFMQLVREQTRAREALKQAAPLPVNAQGEPIGYRKWNPETGEWQTLVVPFDKRPWSPDQIARARKNYDFEDGPFQPFDWDMGEPRPYVPGESLDNLSPTDLIGEPWYEPTVEDIGRYYGHLPPLPPKPQKAAKDPRAQQAQKQAEQQPPQQLPGLAGGRYQQPSAFGRDAIQMEGGIDLPGDQPSERSGRIKRLASVAIPAALATGAGVANASQEMGDQQIDALAASLPTAAEPLSREQLAEQAKAQLDLNALMSPKVKKRPVADENSPFDADYWRTGLSRHIQEHPPEFKQAFAEAMNAPVMRVGGEGVYFQTSVKDYLASVQRTYSIPDETMRNVVRRLKGMKPSTEDDNSDAIVESTLAALHQSVPGEHSAAYNPAVTDTEKAQWDKDANDFKIPASEVRYKLTKEGEQGYQAERVFNLLSTFQTNQFSPETSSAMSRVATNAGQFFDATGDTAKLAEYDQSTPEGRMATALYWWNRGTPDGTSGDSITGAKYPSLSSTTMPGIGGHLSNTDNYLARYAMQPFENTLYATDQSRETRQAVQELRDRLYRTTPIVPDGTTPEEIQQQKSKLRDLDMNSRSWASPTYAKMMRDLYESEGMAGSIARALADTSAWTGNPADKPRPPATTPEEKAYAEWRRSQGYESKHTPDPQFSYLSPMGEFAANLPRDYIDLASVFGVAAKAPAAAARVAKATRSLNTLKGFGELAQNAAKTTGKMAVNELPSETAVGSALLAGTMPPSEEERSAADAFKWLVTPQKTSPLMKDEQGNPVPADAPRDQFDAAYKRAIRDRNRAFRDLDQYEQTLQQRAKASTQR